MAYYQSNPVRVHIARLQSAAKQMHGAAARAAKVLGYHRIVTYILDTESAVSLRASGWQCAGLAGGREWTCLLYTSRCV